MKHFKSTIFLLVAAYVLSSCSNNFQKGTQAYNELQYGKSSYYLKKAVESKPDDVNALRLLADGYRQTNQTRKAESIYAKLVKGKKTAAKATNEDIFNYAKMLMANEKYEDAREWLGVYDSVTNSVDPVAKYLMHSCDSVDMFKQDTALYTMNEVVLRGIGERFGAVPYDNGIVFTAEVTNPKAKKAPYATSGYLDLFYSEKDTAGEGDWSKPAALKGKINSLFHDGPACFNKEGTVCYFSRSSVNKVKDKSGKILAINNLKLYRAEKEGTSWQNVKELPFNSDNFNNAHPSLSEDGSELYFMSDRPEGLGGSDIYVAQLDPTTGEFGEPKNLGPNINTASNEVFPFIAADDVLYFSTDGRYSLGGYDVYAAKGTADGWGKPENLNSPINTSHDDYCFVVKADGETGYVSSNRTGKDRIFDWVRNDPVLFVEGFVKDKKTQLPLKGAKVELINNKDKSTIATTTDDNGKYSFDGIACRSNYDIRVSKGNSYVASKDVLRTVKELKRHGFSVDLSMDPVEINKDIPLRRIYYAFNKWFIRKDAAKTLDSLAKKLRDNPLMDIELGSHTDARGSARYNLWLSERRAGSVVYYLRKKGIDKRRMIPKGYGETQISNRCVDGVKCSEKEHQVNRRTTFKVLNIRDKNQQPNSSALILIGKKLEQQKLAQLNKTGTTTTKVATP